MDKTRLRPWVLGLLAAFFAVLAVWIVSDRWGTDSSPGSKGEPDPGPEVAESIFAAPDKGIESAAVSGPDAGLEANSAEKNPYYMIKEKRRERYQPDATANSPEDRIKALSRLAGLGYKPWEAEELRTLWDGEMDSLDQELERRRRQDPARSLAIDRRLLELEAYANLREGLDAADYAAVRYAAEEATLIEVYRVSSGSFEEEVGLWPGDQLFSYDGEQLFDINQFKALTDAEIDQNRPVVLGFRRDGQEFFVEIPGGDLQIPLMGIIASP